MPCNLYLGCNDAALKSANPLSLSFLPISRRPNDLGRATLVEPAMLTCEGPELRASKSAYKCRTGTIFKRLPKAQVACGNCLSCPLSMSSTCPPPLQKDGIDPRDMWIRLTVPNRLVVRGGLCSSMKLVDYCATGSTGWRKTSPFERVRASESAKLSRQVMDEIPKRQL